VHRAIVVRVHRDSPSLDLDLKKRPTRDRDELIVTSETFEGPSCNRRHCHRRHRRRRRRRCRRQ
jgi:hypothetical protein